MKTKIKINWSHKKPPIQTEIAEPVPQIKVQVTAEANAEVPQAKKIFPFPVPAPSDFEGDLKLEPIAEASAIKPKKNTTIGYLASLDGPPEDMDQKQWEEKISAERLSILFKRKMKERFDLDSPGLIPVIERSCLKRFYRYLQNLSLAEEILAYVIDNWAGIKARYKLPYEYPVAQTFANNSFAKQIAIEHHKKKNVTSDNPTYINDFRDDENGSQSEYQSDW